MNYNLYAGAFLGTVFVVMTVGIASDTIYYSGDPEQEGFAIAVLDAPAGGEEPADEGLQPITPLLASADIGEGPTVFRKCQSCHVVEAGGENRTGPNLWGVVGAQAGTHAGFDYSTAMQDYASDGAIWDFEALNRFLYAPGDYIDGTSMRFAGLPRESERANLIAWLAQQADDPVPFDAFETADAVEDAVPAEQVIVDEADPGDEAPAGDMPAEDTPTEEAPAEEAPADEAPAAEMPAEDAPVDEAPTEETAPADEMPVEETPAEDAAPADEDAAEETPAE